MHAFNAWCPEGQCATAPGGQAAAEAFNSLDVKANLQAALEDENARQFMKEISEDAKETLGIDTSMIDMIANAKDADEVEQMMQQALN